MVGLNLGCGLKPIKGFLNVDKIDIPSVAPSAIECYEFLCFDLNQRPWPWADESCDVVIMRDCLEHLNSGSFIEVMDEVWRILKFGSQVAIQVPDASYHTAFTDPMHQMFFTKNSMDYFDPQTVLGSAMYHYTPKKFAIVKCETTDSQCLHFVLRKIQQPSPCERLIHGAR